MRLPVLLAATLLFTAATAHASDLALTHATVYTTPEAPPLKDATILIHDGKITGVAHSLKAPATATTIDCTGLTITAGFWNSHVHILPPQLLHAEEKSDADLAAQLQTMFTHWGFTTVFDVASVLANTNNIRPASPATRSQARAFSPPANLSGESAARPSTSRNISRR